MHLSSLYTAVTAVLVAVSYFVVNSSSQNQHTSGEDVFLNARVYAKCTTNLRQLQFVAVP